jgi:hypothetical protein
VTPMETIRIDLLELPSMIEDGGATTGSASTGAGAAPPGWADSGAADGGAADGGAADGGAADGGSTDGGSADGGSAGTDAVALPVPEPADGGGTGAVLAALREVSRSLTSEVVSGAVATVLPAGWLAIAIAAAADMNRPVTATSIQGSVAFPEEERRTGARRSSVGAAAWFIEPKG